ncbi:MAG TPA: SDR family oxidoreductase [bacterium]|nr:SDR family oxidoreductase [bacterium]
MENQSLQGKKILITGGTTGIGRATAVLLSQMGANVFIFGRHERELDDAFADIERLSGKKAFGLTADVANPDDVEKVFAQVKKDFAGKLDVLINNAALPAGNVIDTAVPDIYYVVSTNLIGYLTCTKYAMEIMRKQKDGHIVFVGSLSAETRDPGSDLYVATKSGISGFVDSFRRSANHEGVKVALIEPGSTGSNLVDEPVERQRQFQLEEKMLKAEDVADAIIFAISSRSRVDIINLWLKPRKQNI